MARGERLEQWKGAVAEEKKKQHKADSRSNGRGRTRGLLDRLVRRPRRAASGRDGRPHPIIFAFLTLYIEADAHVYT